MTVCHEAVKSQQAPKKAARCGRERRGARKKPMIVYAFDCELKGVEKSSNIMFVEDGPDEIMRVDAAISVK